MTLPFSSHHRRYCSPRRLLQATIVLSLFAVSYYTLHKKQDHVSAESHHVDWSRFAYVSYATNWVHLCNSLVMFASLHQLGSNADRLLMYSRNMPEGGKTSSVMSTEMLRQAEENYQVKLWPIDVIYKDGIDRGSWLLCQNLKRLLIKHSNLG